MIRKTLIAGVFLGFLLPSNVLYAGAPQLPDLLKGITSGNEAEKVKAINQLEDLGVSNETVVKVLSSQLRNDSATVRAHAVHALGVLKSPGNAELVVPLMRDKNAEVRQAVIHALRELKPGPKVMVPLVDQALKETDPAVRMHALTMVAEIGKPAVPALIKCLDNEESAPWCCIALGAIGADAAEAVPALTKLLDSPHSPKIRLEAAMALASIGPASASAMPELMKILDKKDPVVLPGAIYAIGRIGPAAKSAEKRLRELAAQDDTFTRVISTWAILKIHPEDRKLLANSLPVIVTALIDQEARIRAAATKALVDLKPDPALAMPAIRRVMEGASPDAMADIVEAIADVGVPAVPNLIKALEAEPLRPKIATLLGRLGPEAREAAPALAGVVEKDKSPVARREALIALGAMGPFAADEAPVITKVLNDEDSKLRAAACYALGKIGPLAIASKANLMECLKSNDELCSMAAAWALTRVDPACPEGSQKSLPCLVKGLFNPDAHIRLEAVNALQLLGGQAREAIPALKKVAADDPQPAVRLAAGEAIKRVEK